MEGIKSMRDNKVSKFNAANIISAIIKYGAHVLFGLSIAVMTYLSFVKNIDFKPKIEDVAIIALVAMFLNYMIWDTYYQLYYNKVMSNDITNKAYSIHLRYYNARKGWKQAELQEHIHMYNKRFREAWLSDVEDITGYSIEDSVDKKGNIVKGIKNGPYKKRPHKWLIWLVKHNKYPKSGIKIPRDVQQILKVGKHTNGQIKINVAEAYRTANRLKKLVMTVLSTFLAASLMYEFISKDNVKEALLQLLLYVAILFMSFFFGALSGNKGAQIKLGLAEEVSELLEEWQNKPFEGSPYQQDELPEKLTFVESKELIEVKEEPKSPINIDFV